MDQRVEGVCVVGAGPHGLIVGRALKQAGVPFTILEKNDDVGGLWDIDNPGSPMYESCHFVSSKNGSSWFDFPMPLWYPDYPSRSQIHQYVRNFADVHGLREAVEFNTEVVHAEPDGERWVIETADGKRRSFEALIVCPGCNWHARMPSFEGGFDGQLIHSVDYKSPSELAGQRVLVVGMGNSGADIACDAVKTAERVFVSMRRGYHFVPKHLFGVPTLDLLNDPTLAPEPVRTLPFPDAVKLTVGDPTRYGFPKPDHQVGETHPIMNTQVLYHAAHGRLEPKGEVDRLEGRIVYFKDGSKEEIDTIICATGYRYRVPFLDEQAFGWRGEHPDFFLTAFIRQHPTLFIFGLFEAGGAPWVLNDQVALMIAEYLHDRRTGAPRAAALRQRVETETVDLQEGGHYLRSDRTVNYIHIPAYERHVHRLVDELGFTRLRPGLYAELRAAAELEQTVVA
jgi:hypothetical protein